MAKKRKSTLFNNVMENAVLPDLQTNTTNLTESVDSIELKENIEIVNNVIQTEKIQFDDVSTIPDELVKMSNENSKLTDKLAEYIDEIQKLKDEIQKLTDENDKHLMKIAELSFENATLQASLKNINTDTENNTNAFKPPQSSKIVNYQQINNNIFSNRSGLNTGDYWN
jgi:predicted nuclease with TOPRIM domain